MKKAVIQIVLGFIVFFVANIMAFIYHYNKFYLFLLLGIFLMLKGTFRIINKKELINFRYFLNIYLAFFILGIIADLILGIWVTKLWSYPSYTLINYIILYLFIYPLGGLTMVYSFALLESIFIEKPRARRWAHQRSLSITKVIFITGLIGLIISLTLNIPFKGFFIYFFVVWGGYGLVNQLILRVKEDNLLERFVTKSLKYGILILVVAYTQGIIHEFPNIFAKEWQYMNFPFQSITFLEIPIMVLFLGWIALVIIPYAVFELIGTKIKKDLHKQTK
ncbi:MAG: hypothetical protein IIA87_00530 [Nanoarchaeota archaeon]|nr:hypothetical protein [Nanoarchaeota archaeon]